MKTRNTRVLLATENPETRTLISEILERERGVEIAGEAPDAISVMTMTRDLRPDVIVLDCYLPHSAGLEAIPLPHLSGVDAAQAISEEIPKSKVIVLNNLDKVAMSGGSLTPSQSKDYCMAIGDSCITLAQWPEIAPTAEAPAPVYAKIKAVAGEGIATKPSNIFDMMVFFGSIGFGTGFYMSITVVLMPIGIPLIGLGGVSVLLGLTGRMMAGWWRKIKGR